MSDAIGDEALWSMGAEARWGVRRSRFMPITIFDSDTIPRDRRAELEVEASERVVRGTPPARSARAHP
jgi:hypothetical protein